jgi:methyltransferase-like protein
MREMAIRETGVKTNSTLKLRSENTSMNMEITTQISDSYPHKFRPPSCKRNRLSLKAKRSLIYQVKKSKFSLADVILNPC